jgi:hypothetical protein
MRRPAPATIIATTALVLAFSGASFAAGNYLITSTKQIKPKVLNELKKPGPRGPAGATGPTGASGAPGTPGAAGVARDAGVVEGGGNGGPSFWSEGLVGWRNVTNPSTGHYCLTPDATSTVANTSLVLSLGGPGAGEPGYVIWDGYCTVSGGSVGLLVVTEDSSATPSNDLDFEAVIPAS